MQYFSIFNLTAHILSVCSVSVLYCLPSLLYKSLLPWKRFRVFTWTHSPSLGRARKFTKQRHWFLLNDSLFGTSIMICDPSLCRLHCFSKLYMNSIHVEEVVGPQQGCTWQSDNVPAEHYVLYTKNSTEWYPTEPFTHSYFFCIIEYHPSRTAAILLVRHASDQKQDLSSLYTLSSDII